MMKSLFLSLFSFLFISVFSTYAQQHPERTGQPRGSSTVTGFIIDKKTSLPVEYATISVLRANDSSVVSGGVSNEKGHFSIEGLPDGTFRLRIQFIGYKTLKTPVFELVGTYNTGKLSLEDANTNLSEVTVSAQRAEIESRIDKKVVSVDATLASSGTAVDVLQRVPSVSVDQDGNVSMRGSSNVTILMDGRQSGYTSLDQIPASIIDRVEVVTNPSARYDASGIGGIINIITKKNSRRGLNGMAQLNVGTNSRNNGNLSLNYAVRKWNIFLNADGRTMKSTLNSNTEYRWYNGDYSLQNSNENRSGRMGGIKCGVDFRATDSSVFSLATNVRGMGFDANGTGTRFLQQDSNTHNISNTTSSSNTNQSVNSVLEFKHTFPGKDHDLTLGVFGSIDRPYSQSNTTSHDSTLSAIKNSLTQTTTTVKSKATELRADYQRPLSKGLQLSIGSKFMYNVATSETNQQLTTLNYDSTTTQRYGVTAAYFILGQTLGKLKLQAGLRAERTQQEITKAASTYAWNHSFTDFFPSGGVVIELTGNQSLQCNYSRRINRPTSPRLLVDAIDRSDPENYSRGNPQLKPEYINAYELSYTYSKTPFSLTSTLFYRQTTGTITRITSQYELDQTKTMSTYINGNSVSSFGFEQMVLMPLSKQIRTNINFSLFGVQAQDSLIKAHFGSPCYTGMIKANIIYTPIKSLDFGINLRYNAPNVSMQGSGDGRPYQSGATAGLVARTWQMDVSVKKEFLEGRLATTLRVQDLFNGDNVFHIHSYSSEFESTVQRTRISRVLYAGISYKINEGLKQNKKRQQEQSGEEF